MVIILVQSKNENINFLLGDCNQIIMQSGAAETIFTMLGNSDTVIQTAAIRCALLLSINGKFKTLFSNHIII